MWAYFKVMVDVKMEQVAWGEGRELTWTEEGARDRWASWRRGRGRGRGMHDSKLAVTIPYGICG